jgi:hypothetical protein
MAHRFEIRKNKGGEFVAYFCYNSETIFWTEGYSSKARMGLAPKQLIPQPTSQAPRPVLRCWPIGLPVRFQDGRHGLLPRSSRSGDGCAHPITPATDRH